jgi:heterotetrameric sarcosine oxidase delta subunit
MFIPCPFCGDREISEFICRGSALPKRPDAQNRDCISQFHDYYYLRSNPAGSVREHWYHGAGCRNWLDVWRDTRSHEFLEVSLSIERPQ